MTRLRLLALSVALILAFLPAPSSAAEPGALTSGGGSRGSEAVQARDALGSAAVGAAAAEDVIVRSGVVPGLPPVTPVILRHFHFTATAEGIVLEWEANSEARVGGFFVEKGEGPAAPATDEGYRRLDLRFPGEGPHRLVDTEVRAGTTYHYRLRAIYDMDRNELYGPWSITAAGGAPEFAAQVFPAAPNPFREAFVVRVLLAETSSIGWSLHDVSGRRLAGGSMGGLEPGYHALAVDPRRTLPAGVYFVQIRAGKLEANQKIVRMP